MTILTAICTATAGVGLLLALIGWRGRCVDDHPWCRRCGYDLVGSGERPATCPECGRKLGSRRGVRIGHRRRRGRLVGAGIALVAIGATLGGLAAWTHRNQFDWNRVKPGLLLAMEAEWATRARSDAALTELTRRIEDGRLPDARVDALVDTALARQADWQRPWQVQWAVLVESARAAGLVDDERWARYGRHGVCLGLAVRPVVRQGDPLPRKLEVHTRFVDDPRNGGRLRGLFQVESLTLADTSLAAKCEIYAWIGGSSPPQHHSGLGHRVHGTSPTAFVEPISTELACTVRIKLWEGSTLVVDWTEQLTAEVEIVSADTELSEIIEVVTDRSLAQEVASSLGAVDCYTFKRRAMIEGPETTHLQGEIEFLAPPVPCAFDVIWRDRGREVHLGSVASHARSFLDQPRQRFGGGGIEGFDADVVDIVLRPSLDVAATTYDITPILGREIILRGVPLQQAPHVRRPADWCGTTP